MEQRQRTGRAIKANASIASPRYILALAVDTLREKSGDSGRTYIHTLKNCTAIHGRLARDKMVGVKERAICSKDEFWDYLSEITAANYTVWIVSNNCLADLIVLGLTECWEQGKITLDRPRSPRKRKDNNGNDSGTQGLLCIESPPTILCCRVASTMGRVVFTDIANWLARASIPNVRDSNAQIPKARTEVCNDAIYGNDTSRLATSIFARFTELVLWVRQNDLGMFRYTAAAQAMSAFRHRFMPQKIYCHDNVEIKQLERASYFGGRTEIFKLGKFTEPVYQLDCNSLFPSVMRENKFPYYLDRYELRPEPLALKPAISWSDSVAEVQLDVPYSAIPLRTEKYIIYPKGKFTTVLCGPELAAANQRGWIVSVGSWAEYKTAPLFTGFVEYFYGLRHRYRAEGNAQYEQYAKRLLNSLYGKFAQKSPAWIDQPNDYSMLPWSQRSHFDSVRQEWQVFRSFGWNVQRMVSRAEKPSSFTAISAFTTSYARLRMDWLRAIAGRRNVYYQGIDGLLVTKTGYDLLCSVGEVHKTQLGKLRLELITYDGEIIGVSDYRLGGKVVLSGRASQYDDWDTGCQLQHRRYVESMLFNGRAVDRYEERLEEFVRSKTYTKGIVQPDGWVEPLELGETPAKTAIGSELNVAAADARSVT